MKTGSCSMMVIAFLAVIFIGTPGWAATLSLTPSATALEQGDSFSVDIGIDNASGIVGCTLSVRYPSNLLDLSITPVTTDFFDIFYDNRLGADPASIFPWEKNTAGTDLIRLAGVYIDPSNGLGAYEGQQILFTLHFIVKSNAYGPFSISLEQTLLFNPTAGWGTDADGDGVFDAGVDSYQGAPILIKAENVGTENDYTVALQSFAVEPLKMFKISSDSDTDGDGVLDVVEMQTDPNCCMDPNIADTDGDGLWDGVEDANGDCIVDVAENETNPCLVDTDNDGVYDGDEDTNKNGVLDNLELDPNNPDTDQDGYTDGFETQMNTEPLNWESSPWIICLDPPAQGLTDCDETATDVTDAKLNCLNPEAEAYYFWLRESMIFNEGFSIENQMLLEIESGRIEIQ